ncbi:MAG: DUF2325 domain-containing protein [Nitrosomonas sp.]|uniref:DUF2325 domain-containing protein n=1 Tax=Nitrosomonas sp. TaxID=42353 RepID=UPI002B38891B|nr:DUF2325 domain-containing protein [Nitrosomonas sp.]MEB2332331.1 DUF2325 domain-containing protein [Nitrosomonas sp.]
MKFFQRTVLEPAYQGAQLHPGKLSGIYQNEILCNSLFHHYKQRTLKLGRELESRLKHLYHLVRMALPGTVSANTTRRSPANSIHTEVQIDSRTDTHLPQVSDDEDLRWIRTGLPHQYHAYLAIDRLKSSHHLAGQSVLCIGGRAALYPNYHQLIEAAGGHFMVFRGGAQDNSECLLALLARVDSIICPVDCINHEDFFTVRRYCQRTGKNCVMLERSDLVTFGKAVETLARGDCHNSGTDFLNQSAA